MRSRIPLFAAAIVCLLAAVSCGGTDTTLDTTASIAPRSTSLSPDGGSVFVQVTASGAWTIDLEYPSGTPSWATADPASGNGSRADVRLRYDANGSSEERQVTMILRPSGGLPARVTVTQQGKSSGIITPGTGISGKDTAAPKWLELPATKAGDGRTFFAHDMEGKEYTDKARSGVRNWSFYWDASEHLAQWVAYPLNRSLRGTGSRSNVWGLDPLLPADAQPNLIMGSYGGGWTRGHQIPSADRLTYAANVSTFYGTNMTPQEFNFNGGIWASLEDKVRSYAFLADTLYVVTGCKWDDSSTVTGTSSGFAVKVPTHYFKALLFKGTSTYTHSGYMAAGFFLPHDPSIAEGKCTDYIMSVSELEKKTGIDFFPLLKDVVGAAQAAVIEDETPSKWWK